MVLSQNFECKFGDTGLLSVQPKLYAVYHPDFGPSAGKTEKPGNSFHVMLADDDEDDRMFFADAIRSIDPSVSLTTVHNGVDLIQQLKQLNESLPDLIFMDINMPYKNGLECLKEIKSNTRFRHLPVLIYSTSVNHDHINDTYRNGASRYIQKPASYDGITRILKDIFALSPSGWKNQPGWDKFVIS